MDLVAERRPHPKSPLGGGAEDRSDAKLSRIVKGAAVLQLCLYADQVRRLQGTAPERIAVVTGEGRLHHSRLDDYDAYFRRVRGRFEERLLSAERVSTCPERVGSAPIGGAMTITSPVWRG